MSLVVMNFATGLTVFFIAMALLFSEDIFRLDASTWTSNLLDEKCSERGTCCLAIKDPGSFCCLVGSYLVWKTLFVQPQCGCPAPLNGLVDFGLTYKYLQ